MTHMYMYNSVLSDYPLEPYDPYLYHKHLTNLTIKLYIVS